MKIAIITSNYYPKVNAGTIRIDSFIKKLSKKNEIDLKIYTSVKNNKKIHNAENEKNYEDSIKTYRVGTDVSNKSNILIRIFSELFSSILLFFYILFAKTDIFFVTSPSFIFAYMTYIVCKIRRKKYILDIRDLYPKALFKSGVLKEKSLKAKILLKMEKKIYDNSHFIITVTEGLEEHIKSITQKEVYLIRNGYDPNVFYKKEKTKNNEFSLVFHGIMGRFQDTDYIVKYAEYIKNQNINDIKIEIAGDGIKKEDFLKQIEEKKLKDIIKYNGYLEQNDIVKLINRCHIGFSPRTNDEISKTAFPVKVYEYLACGLPVIVSPQGECSEMLEKNKCGFGVDFDILKLHNFILSLKENKNLYSNYSENAVNLSKNFNREEIAEELYKKIIRML